MKKIVLVILLIFYISFISKINNVKLEEIIIPKDAIRLRVIANSNNEYDQKIKLKLTMEIEKRIQELLKGTKDIKEARNIIKNNVSNLNIEIKNILEKENYNQKYTIVYSNNYFPEKMYKGITYKQGYYESLVITLGKGEGKNWWCVLFPPLCLMEAEETGNHTEYKFFVKEILNKYF